MIRHYFVLLLCVSLVVGVVVSCGGSRGKGCGRSVSSFDGGEIIGPECTPYSSLACPKAECAENAPGHLEYLYSGYCKEQFPDFAALAVLESQSCPPPPVDENTLCASSYRIIRILDSVSDTLNKERIEVKEHPLYPGFKYRPVLIFGNYYDGMIQIEAYEDVRDYFHPIRNHDIICWGFYSNLRYVMQELQLFRGYRGTIDFRDMYYFHSIGTPYYDTTALDSIDKIYYDKYLIPAMKQRVEFVGKDFNDLWLRLTQNRTEVKAFPIEDDFAALGVMLRMFPDKDSAENEICVFDIPIEHVIKKEGGGDSILTIYKQGSCPSIWLVKKPLYLFGNFKGDSVAVESFIDMDDVFVLGDTVYDISMGFPFEDFLEYFWPPDFSVNEWRSCYVSDGTKWRYSRRYERMKPVRDAQKEYIETACAKNTIWPELSRKYELEKDMILQSVEVEGSFGYGNRYPKHKKFRCSWK